LGSLEDAHIETTRGNEGAESATPRALRCVPLRFSRGLCFIILIADFEWKRQIDRFQLTDTVWPLTGMPGDGRTARFSLPLRLIVKGLRAGVKFPWPALLLSDSMNSP
jgi:hypothetical protein